MSHLPTYEELLKKADKYYHQQDVMSANINKKIMVSCIKSLVNKTCFVQFCFRQFHHSVKILQINRHYGPIYG